MTTKTLKPRPQDADFQTRLKSLCLEYGISFHVFAGEYEKTSVQKEGRAVVSLAGSVENILRLVDALNYLMLESSSTAWYERSARLPARTVQTGTPVQQRIY